MFVRLGFASCFVTTGLAFSVGQGASLTSIEQARIVGAGQDCTDIYTLPTEDGACTKCIGNSDGNQEKCDDQVDETCAIWTGPGCIHCDVDPEPCPGQVVEYLQVLITDKCINPIPDSQRNCGRNYGDAGQWECEETTNCN